MPAAPARKRPFSVALAVTRPTPTARQPRHRCRRRRCIVGLLAPRYGPRKPATGLQRGAGHLPSIPAPRKLCRAPMRPVSRPPASIARRPALAGSRPSPIRDEWHRRRPATGPTFFSALQRQRRLSRISSRRPRRRLKASSSFQASTKDGPPATQKAPAPATDGTSLATARPASRAMESRTGTGVTIKRMACKSRGCRTATSQRGGLCQPPDGCSEKTMHPVKRTVVGEGRSPRRALERARLARRSCAIGRRIWRRRGHGGKPARRARQMPPRKFLPNIGGLCAMFDARQRQSSAESCGMYTRGSVNPG